jgi:hypothetical protein
MEEEFELPVKYKGEEQMLNAKLIVTGYTHKFSVDIKGQIIVFEPDEERNYRKVIDYENLNTSATMHKELLRRISELLRQLANYHLLFYIC